MSGYLDSLSLSHSLTRSLILSPVTWHAPRAWGLKAEIERLGSKAVFDTLSNDIQKPFVEVSCKEYAAFVNFAQSEIGAKIQKKSVPLRWKESDQEFKAEFLLQQAQR